MLLFIIVVLAAIAFEYINGFHDAANAIATVVSTKVLTPRQAIALAAFFNLTGALMGTAVASTIGKGIVDTKVITMTTVLCALLGAIIWNLLTWWLGLPSSSSHALIGGLCGAALASADGDWSVLKWNTGLMPKVVVPMFTSPVIGFLLGGILMALLFAVLRPFTPHIVHKIFGKLQLVSAAWMAHSHGTNDAQKTMGIIALALFTATQSGAFADLPPMFAFLQTPEFKGPELGGDPLRRHHGRGHSGGRLANHPHPRPQDGQTSAGARFRGRDHRRRHHPRRERAWNSALHHACHLHLHHGRRRRETLQRGKMGRG